MEDSGKRWAIRGIHIICSFGRVTYFVPRDSETKLSFATLNDELIVILSLFSVTPNGVFPKLP